MGCSEQSREDLMENSVIDDVDNVQIRQSETWMKPVVPLPERTIDA